jgi:ribosomal protein L37AE/L43A
MSSICGSGVVFQYGFCYNAKILKRKSLPIRRPQMALRTCPECHKEVSTDATVCPHCGKPLKGKLVSKPLGCLLQLSAIPLIIWGFVEITGKDVVLGVSVLIVAGVLVWAGGTAARY